jgi:hypothetical protein
MRVPWKQAASMPFIIPSSTVRELIKKIAPTSLTIYKFFIQKYDKDCTDISFSDHKKCIRAILLRKIRFNANPYEGVQKLR